MLLVSESRITKDIENSEININGYSVIRCDSASRHTGGVTIFVKDSINFSVFKTFAVEGVLWCKVIKVHMGYSCQTLIGCIYRSPSGSEAAFLDYFESICDSIFATNMKCVLVGDFNIDLLIDSFYACKIKKLFLQYGIEQLITKPTRVTIDSSTLIDYVLVNNNQCHANVHDTPKVSDHSIISANFSKINCLLQTPLKKYRNLCKENMDKIILETMSCDWSLNSIDVDVIYNEIFSHCETIINNISPILTCKYENNVPWFDNDIFYAINLRDKSYKAFKGSTGNDRQEKWDIFKQRRNMTVNLIKKKKERYYLKKIDRYSNNSQLMWKTLKKLVNISYNEFPKRIEFNNSGNINVVHDITEISNKLNNYFVCSVKEIVNSINQDEVWSYCDYNLYACFAEFSLLTLHDLNVIVNSVDNHMNTHDILNSKMTKLVYQGIGHVILNLVNTSLQTGNISHELKVSTIIPIPKVANTIKAEELRPINTLPPIEKILELAVYNQLLEHVEYNSCLD
ncbi:hypothetical protein NQ317_008330 [Molorchus minor]|uniref:Endonuclease/exonuclease/phosphatase domain-containing protein n=1 Tax=Molorchus minor TaxID=1323400 RepID=A0ABQ9JR94_9CUCU|nr:hypothetical protein NQ317_008330 [Molorchus minor]